jgi:glycosyltransferase involved in cell wall biosynthesis
MAKSILPSYQEYKSQFAEKGITSPLKQISFEHRGVFDKLPKAKKQGWPWDFEVAPEVYREHQHWPKISVISPSYNQGIYFEETIRSVLLQNYPNLEYIIMDGGSDDDTVSVLKKYEDWISYWESEKDRGQSHAINKGFSLASGEIYCWINSDDYFLPESFLKVAKQFMRSETLFIYGNGYNLEETRLLPSISHISFDRYLRIPLFFQPSCFWKSSIHQPVWEELHCTMDYELWLRIVKGNKRKYLNEFLSVARVHEKAKTYNPDKEAKAKWHEDHLKEVSIHGPVNNWDMLVKENYYLQKLLKSLPFLKVFF